MIRTALRPRWLAWLVFALAAVYVCLRLGSWQLGVAHAHGEEDARREAQARPPVALSSILTPHAPWDGRVLANRRVTATGVYDPGGQRLVPHRLLDGRDGYWVLTPLRTTGPAGVLPTVRGWVPTPSAPAAPTGTRTVVASLVQGESPAASAGLPAGQVASIDLARLVNEWPGDLYNAIALVASETPADAAAPTRVPPPRPESGLNIRNAAYAVQWWVFGLFCPLLWWRMVLAAHRDEVDAAHPDPQPPHEGA